MDLIESILYLGETNMITIYGEILIDMIQMKKDIKKHYIK